MVRSHGNKAMCVIMYLVLLVAVACPAPFSFWRTETGAQIRFICLHGFVCVEQHILENDIISVITTALIADPWMVDEVPQHPDSTFFQCNGTTKQEVHRQGLGPLKASDICVGPGSKLSQWTSTVHPPGNPSPTKIQRWNNMMQASMVGWLTHPRTCQMLSQAGKRCTCKYI